MVLVFVHTLEVLLKVVQTRPSLVWFCAILGETLVVFGPAIVNVMHRLEMPIQVIRGRKSLPLLCTVGEMALELFRMPSVVFTDFVSREHKNK